jgi:hypothetical protein
MVKEKSVKSDKTKEGPTSNENGNDIEMADAAPEPVCYIQTLNKQSLWLVFIIIVT